MKGMTLSKHGDHLVKRNWLPGQHISLNTSNMVETEKAYQGKPHIWASLASAEVLMRCAGESFEAGGFKLVGGGGNVSGF